MVQEAEMEKQILQQQVQTFTDMIEYLGGTTVKSVDEFISRLKLDLNLFAGDNRLTGEFHRTMLMKNP